MHSKIFKTHFSLLHIVKRDNFLLLLSTAAEKNHYMNIIQKLNSRRIKKQIAAQIKKKVTNSKNFFLNSIKAASLNAKGFPNEKGFFGRKLEKFITFCLLDGCEVTKDFGPSDINQKFLINPIGLGYLIPANLQIKGSRTKTFSTADLFYFLECSSLNMLLINYKVNTRKRTFKITEVYNVRLFPPFFDHVINVNEKWFEVLFKKKYPFHDKLKTYNTEKKKYIKTFNTLSITAKVKRWQGNFNLTSAIKFFKKNESYGQIEKLKVNNDNFIFCGVTIEPLVHSY